MTMFRSFSTTILILICFHSYAQLLHLSKHSFGITVKTLLTTPMKITPNETAHSAKKMSRSTIGFEGAVTYRYRHKERTEIKIEKLLGLYPYESDVVIGKEFSQLDYELDYIDTEFEIFYAGINLGVSRIFSRKAKSAFHTGVGLNLVFFLPHSIGEGVSISDDNGSFNRIYDASIEVNKDFSPCVGFEGTFGWYRKLGNRLLANMGVTYLFSTDFPIEGSYSIFSDSGNILTGHFKKRFAYGAAVLGVVF